FVAVVHRLRRHQPVPVGHHPLLPNGHHAEEGRRQAGLRPLSENLSMDMQFLQDNWMLVALALIPGAMLLWNFVGGKVSGVEQADTLKATWLYNDDAMVLDVREDKEYAAGHIPKAKHIPLGQLAGRLNELEK